MQKFRLNTKRPFIRFSPSRLLIGLSLSAVILRLNHHKMYYFRMKQIREEKIAKQSKQIQYDYNFNQNNDFQMSDIFSQDQKLDIKQLLNNSYFILFAGSLKEFIRLRNEVNQNLDKEQIKMVYLVNDQHQIQILKKVVDGLDIDLYKQTLILKPDDSTKDSLYQELDIQPNSIYFFRKGGQLVLYDELRNNYNKYLNNIQVQMNKDNQDQFMQQFQFNKK